MESKKIMFLLITSRRIELEGRATSQIVGNSKAIVNLSNFFKFDKKLAAILALRSGPYDNLILR